MKSRKSFLLIKRMSDIIVSIILFILLLPVILVAAILIVLDGTGGSIVIKNPKRVGRNGVQFSMFKFRTMIPGAHDALRKDPSMKQLKSKQEENGKLGIHEDVRITSIGKFLRTWDIDEIPQLVNVLKGEMSLIRAKKTTRKPKKILKNSFRLDLGLPESGRFQEEMMLSFVIVL